MAKDNFSLQAGAYARYRPEYPPELFAFLEEVCARKESAWDCATGNGQIAYGLSAFFGKVAATDISAEQLKQARKAANITYRQEEAEHSSFADHSFDLIVTGQAIHWFRFDDFYREVYRTLRPGGLFVVTGYDQPQIAGAAGQVLNWFHREILGPYWDPERIYVDEKYATIPFPFTAIETPALAYRSRWNLAHLLGYVESWSAVQHYRKARGEDPLPLLEQALKVHWDGGSQQEVVFPLLLRAGTLPGAI